MKNVVLDIKRYLQAFDHWDCVWISRKENGVADLMSKMGRMLPSQGLIMVDGKDLNAYTCQAEDPSLTPFCNPRL